MRLRLALALCGTVVVALLVAGVGTLVIATARAERSTAEELSRQMTILLEDVDEATASGQRPAALANRLNSIRRLLRIESVGVSILRPNGTFVPPLPPDVRLDASAIARLRANQTVSGSQGRTVFVAGARVFPTATVVVVATDRTVSALDVALGWFVLAALLTLAVGVLVALVLSRRLAAPIRDADAVTRRLAVGELSARVVDPPTGRDELSDLVRNVNALAGTLERSKLLEQQFLLSVSHDLRTPLTSIRGFAEAITDGTAPDPQRAAGVILQESRRLERLVRDLLELAKLDARSFTFALRPTDLRALAGDVGAAFEHSELRVVGPAAGPAVPVVVDPDRMAQVIANLLDNACRFADREITLSVDSTGDRARIVVDDDGPGIPPDALPRVFDRLYTSRTAPRRAESGSGLGLAIVRELVGAMGGTVEAQVAPSGGARFVVSLPSSGPLPPPVSPAAGTGR